MSIHDTARPTLNLEVQEYGTAAQEARKIDVDSVMETSEQERQR